MSTMKCLLLSAIFAITMCGCASQKDCIVMSIQTQIKATPLTEPVVARVEYRFDPSDRRVD